MANENIVEEIISEGVSGKLIIRESKSSPLTEAYYKISVNEVSEEAVNKVGDLITLGVKNLLIKARNINLGE